MNKKYYYTPISFVFSFLIIIFLALKIMNPEGFKILFVLENNLKNFYPWQLITYIFNDSTSLLYYFFKVLIVFWFCSRIEVLWGSVHFSILIISGILAKSFMALIVYQFIPNFPFESLLNGYGSALSPNPVMLTLITTFGFAFPNEKIYLFFILPFSLKIFAYISMALAVLQLILFFMQGLPLFIAFSIAVVYMVTLALQFMQKFLITNQNIQKDVQRLKKCLLKSQIKSLKNKYILRKHALCDEMILILKILIAHNATICSLFRQEHNMTNEATNTKSITTLMIK